MPRIPTINEPIPQPGIGLGHDIRGPRGDISSAGAEIGALARMGATLGGAVEDFAMKKFKLIEEGQIAKYHNEWNEAFSDLSSEQAKLTDPEAPKQLFITATEGLREKLNSSEDLAGSTMNRLAQDLAYYTSQAKIKTNQLIESKKIDHAIADMNTLAESALRRGDVETALKEYKKVFDNGGWNEAKYKQKVADAQGRAEYYEAVDMINNNPVMALSMLTEKDQKGHYLGWRTLSEQSRLALEGHARAGEARFHRDNYKGMIYNATVKGEVLPRENVQAAVEAGQIDEAQGAAYVSRYVRHRKPNAQAQIEQANKITEAIDTLTIESGQAEKNLVNIMLDNSTLDSNTIDGLTRYMKEKVAPRSTLNSEAYREGEKLLEYAYENGAYGNVARDPETKKYVDPGKAELARSTLYKMKLLLEQWIKDHPGDILKVPEVAKELQIEAVAGNLDDIYGEPGAQEKGLLRKPESKWQRIERLKLQALTPEDVEAYE